MVVVHHLENSRSQRILWLLEELQVEYRVEHYARDPQTMLAPPALLGVHPLGKSPVVVDGDSVVAESGAIIEYLLRQYGEGRLKPGGGPSLTKFSYWLHYAEGSLMPWLLMKLVFSRLSKPPMPLPLRPIAGVIAVGVSRKLIGPRLKEHFDFIESQLAGSDWLAGDSFTAADIQMSFPLEAAAERVGFNGYPNIRTYLQRLHDRPAYGRALEQGGPYAYS